MPDPGKLEVSTDKGVKGYGNGGIAGGQVVIDHFTKLLLGEDPFNIERIITDSGGGPTRHQRHGARALGFDRQRVGHARLQGGETKPRIPTYCMGNDIEQHIQFGYKRLKLAVPYGPADGPRRPDEEYRAREAHSRVVGR